MDIEYRIVWPDGSVRFIKAAAQTFRDEVGRPLRMVGVNYDITERKLAEELLTFSEMERRYVTRVLEHTKGNRQAAARIVNVDRKTIDRMIKRHHIDIKSL